MVTTRGQVIKRRGFTVPAGLHGQFAQVDNHRLEHGSWQAGLLTVLGFMARMVFTNGSSSAASPKLRVFLYARSALARHGYALKAVTAGGGCG